MRGNGKIIQELEGDLPRRRLERHQGAVGLGLGPADRRRHRRPPAASAWRRCVDGEYQDFKSKNGAYVREHFFGKYPELQAMVADWSDEEIWSLTRGGHDPLKVYAAYARGRQHHKGQPTVILAKTVKGYGMGEAGEGQNITHQQKKMGEARPARVPRPLRPAGHRRADPGGAVPQARPRTARRWPTCASAAQALGGSLPARRQKSERSQVPPLSAFEAQLKATGERDDLAPRWRSCASSTRCCATRRSASAWCRSCPTRSRTFGMEGMFRQFGIFSQVGQLYQPEDADQLMFYKEDKNGQILQEGINEPGAMSSWIAAATSYSTNDVPMIPFYIYYSMFGFQRVGDLAWAAGDMRARGFLIGGTAGRTTLNGEGLQHEDGHSHIFSSAPSRTASPTTRPSPTRSR